MRGLASEEARRRLASHGPNALPEAPRPPLWRLVVRQLQSALIYMLLAALGVDLGIWIADGAVGVPIEPIAIAAILVRQHQHLVAGAATGFGAPAVLRVRPAPRTLERRPEHRKEPS